MPRVITEKAKETLRECAADVIEIAGSPGNLLRFVNDAIDWIHNLNEGKIDSETRQNLFSLKLLIDDIIIPWIDGKDIIKEMGSGLGNLWQFYGTEGFKTCLLQIFTGWGNCSIGGFYTDEYLRGIMNGFKALCSIHESFEFYEEEITVKED